MSRYKLIAFDMDGTLLDSNKQVREDSLAAIREATERGKYVALSTGRCLPELRGPLQTLADVRYVIATSGGLLYDAWEKQVIGSAPIPYEVVKEMLSLAAGEDLVIHMHSLDSIVQKKHAPELENYGMGVYQRMFDEVASKIDDIHDYYDKERFPVFKFNLYCRDEAQRVKMAERFAHLPLTMIFAERTSLECSALGVTKGSGLKQLCEILQIDIAETIAVGDADNDLPILETAGLAVAMGNANDKVKAAADRIVADCDNGGCAQAIYEELLNEA